MLDHNQLTPEEAQEQYQPLIRDLRRYYNTRTEDSASLARIQARLLEKAISLPVTENRGASPPLWQTKHQKIARRKFVPPFAKDRPRYRTLSTLAAAILLVVLVGSFVLLIHTGTGGAIQHGWTLVAKFSGTGNQTISGQNIEEGHKFGWLLTCTNTQEGGIAVKFNENANGSSWSTCQRSVTGPLGPESFLTSPAILPPIHTIVVTPDASTTAWELLLFKGTYYPPLSIDTINWHPLLDEMDGTGNGTWGVNVTLPRTWALAFACHGTGYIQISLQSGSGYNPPEISGARTPCDGQPNLDVTDGSGQGERVSQVQITTGADNDWQVLLVACTNGKPHCGITTITPTATP